ncbi:MAG: T9SS type A sorting domain-containing protein [Bacteroidales bacterium]|nr:T9SS type A sorting domain-containing protein [Bacteroidales bacterium]
MKKLILLLSIIALSIGITKAQTPIDNNYFIQNLPTYIWHMGGSPYLIKEDINIPFGSDLIIESGVEVLFQGHYYMDVKGSINAIGNPDERIIFTSEVIGEPWNGIRFDFPDNQNPTPSKLHYCDISNARKYGINCSSPDPESSGGAIYVESFSDLEIVECEIFNNSVLGHGGAIAIFTNSNPSIQKTIIHNNYAKHRGGGISVFINSSPDVLGNSIYENESAKGGGAIFIGHLNVTSTCSPNIIGNNISNNVTSGLYSSSSNIWYGEGGGIYICSSNPTIESNTFNNNDAFLDGGGIYIKGSSDVTMENNSFIKNHSNTNGGGISCTSALTNPVKLCQFSNNSAVNGGGIFLGGADLTIANCSFSENIASTSGGGVYLSQSESDITYCSFLENIASTDGGGIYVLNSTSIIKKCTFDGNTATGNGGGIFMINPTENFPTDISTINLNAFKINTAYQGSALYLDRTSNYANNTKVLNNLFVKNHSIDNGVVYMQGDNNKTIFNHNTISDNTTNVLVNGVCVENETYFPVSFYNNIIYEAILDVCVMDPYIGYPTNYTTLAGINYLNYDNNYNQNPNPSFVSTTDYHLSSASPCINAGVNSAPMTAIDLDGNLRISNVNTDYGSYEYSSTPQARRSNPNSLILNEDISIYPNPATDFLIINTANEQNMDISIYSMSGQRIYLSENSLINGEKTISLLGFKSGVYFIKLQTQSATIKKKIIVK